jgi:hypothetical protein
MRHLRCDAGSGRVSVTAEDLRIDPAVLERWLTSMDRARPVGTPNRLDSTRDLAYFVRDGGAVKIGCSERPLVRFEELQKANPRRIELVALFAAGAAAEAYFHGRFSVFRIHGEWYRIAGGLRRFLDALAPRALEVAQ